MSNKFSEFKTREGSINNKKDIEQMINDYSSLSQEDLMNQFMELSRAQKQSGKLNREYVDKLQSTLFPYLTDTQKQKFFELMDEIK